MTKGEAIKILGQYDVSDLHFYTTEGEEIPFTEWSDAIEMAISALQAQDLQPTYNQLATDCVSRQAAIDEMRREYNKYDSDYPTDYQLGLSIGMRIAEQLPSAQPEYYDYSDIEPLWKSFAEENDINLTDTARQLKDAMWCGYRKGKADAQSEPYKEKLNEIASALSEKFAYMNTCLNERDIILGYLGVKRSCETHCNTDCTNTKCESHPSAAQPEQRWIPCSEEPDNDREVFIARGELKFMSVCIGYYDHDYKQWYESRNWFAKCLYDGLYWCEIPPLPEPYKGES